jgi:hypothetical protein
MRRKEAPVDETNPICHSLSLNQTAFSRREAPPMRIMSAPCEDVCSRCVRSIAVFCCVVILSIASCPPISGQTPDPGANQARPLYRIEVEDATEAALIEQELKVRPELIQGRSFYYYGDENINKQLRALDYQPALVDPDDVLTRLVRVERKGTEAALRDFGVTIVLREREYWVVRGTPRQLRVLSRSGYKVQELGKWEPRPRQIRLIVSNASQVAEVAGLRVDVYSAQKTEQGYVIHGAAFDDVIDELQARGFKVEILPDPPGVIR